MTKTMVIQTILGPREDVCNEWEMFYRGVKSDRATTISYIGAKKTHEKSAVRIKSKEKLSFETYFNAFSVGKWVKYTNLTNLTLRLTVAGDVRIKGYQAVGATQEPEIYDAWNDKMLYACIHSQRRECAYEVEQIDSEDVCDDGSTKLPIHTYLIHFHKLYHQGIVFPVIEAKSKAYVIDGAYETEIEEEKIRPVDFVLGICTFKREEFLKKNVTLIVDEVLKNKKSPLYGHAEVYISDNGQTLDKDTFANNKVHLFHNKNAGGAGGFTRTMIESLFREKKKHFSHIILMDDDIILSTEVLERTYHFLTMVKEEYARAMVGGEMFMLDKRYKQFEAGATWKGTEVRFYHKMWDLRRRDCVSANEVENPINYSGWWYNVIPTEIIRDNNLPIPLFIHYDDMEYGVRNEKNGTILLNGICVWHPQGVNKAPTRMTYYDVRNMLIGMSASEERASASQVLDMLTQRIVGGVIRYRYQDAEICFEAVKDFYRGPQFFMNLDPMAKHEELARFNYEYITPQEAGADMSILRDKTYRKGEKFIFLWGLFCWILPPMVPMKVAGISDIGLPFLAKELFHYDKYKEQGYLTKRDYGRAFRDVIAYFKMAALILRKHEKVMDEWAEAKEDYTSLTYWEQYLEI